MHELCSYGSVGEPVGNHRLYPDRAKKSSGREEAKAETLRWNSVGTLNSHPERLATPGSEFCVVVREDGTKRKQPVLKPCD